MLSFNNIWNQTKNWFSQIRLAIIFLMICCIAYEQGLRIRDKVFIKLQTQYASLEEEKKRALAIQEDLLLQINSQSDPAWVELTLMKVLGVVPEGYKKVYFSE
jgi:hypothetical protein